MRYKYNPVNTLTEFFGRRTSFPRRILRLVMIPTRHPYAPCSKVDIWTLYRKSGGHSGFKDSMCSLSSAASFCASATCFAVIFGLSLFLYAAAYLLPWAAARFNQA